MKNFFLLLIVFWLSGCDSVGQDLDNFILSNKSDQVQEMSSEKNPENWVAENFPDGCEWFDLERVVDGDTVVVSAGSERIRVRMIGIDTPESKKPGTEIQPFAIEAGRMLKEFVKNESEVCLIEDEIGDGYDIYGRKLAYVFTREGLDLNGEMLKRGMARAYLRFPFERKVEFAGYFEGAKEGGVGRWE